MFSNYNTKRLLLTKLNAADAAFIFNLVNTKAWIQYIGDRNIQTLEDAAKYIEKITANRNISYWVVKLKETQKATGIITIIKRDYLEYHDIGFAFLPEYTKKGYAFEAASTVLKEYFDSQKSNTVFAITIKENLASIELLKKLGFMFTKEIRKENEDLLLYSVTTEA